MTTAKCAKCDKLLDSYFRVERRVHDNVTVGANLCSVVCLLQWTYDYATLQGAQVAFGVRKKFEDAQGAIASLIAAVKRK